jgi:hypothetical protein
MNGADEFYIGWEDRMPPALRRRVRWLVAWLFVLALALGVLLAAGQRLIGVSVFEWGKIKSFSGVLESRPYPRLLVRRPGVGEGPGAFSSYHLVRPFKFGLDAGTSRRFDGEAVELQGTLIYRDGQTMIEVAENSIRAASSASRISADSPAAQAAATRPVPLGRQTLVGEIVDSKCYLGVMNPGQLATHRGCAIRCISGGIPPVLLVRLAQGAPLCFLLVSSAGQPVNQQVLDLVAEPVEITGDVERQGELLVLRADPATYRRMRY